jgi:hypothetical protein
MFGRFVHVQSFCKLSWYAHTVSRPLLAFTLQFHQASIKRVMVLELAGKAKSTCTEKNEVSLQSNNPSC